jgi:hypothetical protein
LFINPGLQAIQRSPLEHRFSATAMILRGQRPQFLSLPEKLVDPVLADLESLSDSPLRPLFGVTSRYDPLSQIHGIGSHACWIGIQAAESLRI